MKERYLDIMSRVVDVYSPERFDAYMAKTKKSGVCEHGFPRLCANIGILMAHDRKLELNDRFEQMIELCCEQMPVCGPSHGTRGNDFSVREILSCILELEQAGLYPQETISRWKVSMAAIDPKNCYRIVAPVPPVAVNNWAAFNAASEQLRCYAGLAQTQDYIENQIASQMFSFDENGMYRNPNDPMVYDLVARNMLSTCLYYGYNGSHREKLEQHLRMAGDLTLLMQSVTGELSYGGRSNQFIHNEAHLAVCFEYEAAQRNRLGDTQAAARFKAAANLALDTIEHWLSIAPGRHIKNYFPVDSKIGCEKYAYYDKYMITVASFLYLAYTFCDDAIAPSSCPAREDGSYTWVSSDAFRKLFCKSGSYFLEAELSSDPHYDASGIGRIHCRGAPSAICLSVPVSIQPKYEIEQPNPAPLSICCGAEMKGNWVYGSDEHSLFQVIHHGSNNKSASAKLSCTLPGCKELIETIDLSNDGVKINVSGGGHLAVLLPAFEFDGETAAQIDVEEKTLTISYKGWRCHYSTNGTIVYTNHRCTNRNGISGIPRRSRKLSGCSNRDRTRPMTQISPVLPGIFYKILFSHHQSVKLWYTVLIL